MIKRAPLIVWFIVLILGVTWWFFGMSPLLEKHTEYKTETENLLIQQDTLAADKIRLEGYKENEIEMSVELQKIERYIPQITNQDALLYSYQDMADTAGVSVTNISFTNPAIVQDAPMTPYKNKKLASMNINMAVEGGYFTLIEFLRRLEQDLGRAGKIETLSLSVGSSDTGTAQMSMSLTGKVYLYISDIEALKNEAQAEAESVVNQPEAGADQSTGE